MSVSVFSSLNCPRCKLLKSFLERHDFTVDSLMIDEPDHQTDAIMFGVMSVPAILRNDTILSIREIFNDDGTIDEKRVLEFVRG